MFDIEHKLHAVLANRVDTPISAALSCCLSQESTSSPLTLEESRPNAFRRNGTGRALGSPCHTRETEIPRLFLQKLFIMSDTTHTGKCVSTIYYPLICVLSPDGDTTETPDSSSLGL
jgi:hypothetical protein